MRVPQVSERIKEAPAQALRGVFAGIGQLLLITDKLRHKTPADQDVPRARTPGAAETVTDMPVTTPAGSQQETASFAAAAPAAEAPPAKPASSRRAAAKPAAAKPATARSTAAKSTAAKPTTAKPAADKPAAAKPATAEPAAKSAATRRAPAKAAADPEGGAAPKPPRRQSTRNLDRTGNVRLLADEANGSPLAATVPDASPAPEPVAAPDPVAAGEAPLPNYDALTVASIRARLRNLGVAQVRQLAEYERAHAGRADVLGMYERRIAKLEAQA